MSDPLRSSVESAVAEGILPASAMESIEANRPWPVVLLTALGAWLAALPLLGVAGLLLDDLVARSIGPYLMGVLMLCGAAVVLRSRGVPLFFEQLAVPVILAGGGTLAFGLFRDLPPRLGTLTVTLVALAVAMAVDRAWLRVLLGATAAGFTCIGLAMDGGRGHWPFTGHSFWLSLHLTLTPWLILLGLQEFPCERPAAKLWTAFETIGTGWVLCVLAGLAWWSGMTFLVAGNFGALGAGFGRELAGRPVGADTMMRFLSAGLSLAGAFWLMKRWPSLYDWRNAGVIGVLVVLPWFLPSLGGVLLAAFLAAGTQRWHLAAAAGLASAWIIGSFYYQLAWPLTEKALLLAGMALLLGLLTWRRHAHDAAAAQAEGTALLDRANILIAMGTVCTLVVANGAIWQKEAIIAEGQPVFIALAPVDPRSLMQGDYMALNFSVPFVVENQIDGHLTAKRPSLVLERDSRGVATPKRLARPNEPLARGELLMELTPKNGRWIMVSDAWFFREGEAQRWAAARFGEFRITPDGQALLVGMADENLKSIRP